MKFAWIKAPGETWVEKKEYITTAIESNINHVLEFDNPSDVKKLGNIKLISNNDEADINIVGFNGEGDNTLSLPSDLNDSIDLKEAIKLKNDGKIVCAYIEILTKQHEELASKLGKNVDYLILISKNWTVIPLENIIASLNREDDIKIIAGVSNYDEAKLALETMEYGTDGVLLYPNNLNDIKKIEELIETSNNENFDLVSAKISNIETLGIGDRVCVDSCTIMKPGEGMLIGSYSKGLFLVHSESVESEYVATRPFRVNAGPVQSYIMTPDNKTKYLSELKTGDEILITDINGESKSAIVGRVKIEKRPLLLIEAKYEKEYIKILLQNAETIRLVTSDKKIVSVTDLEIGDEILIYFNQGARHFGMSIDETIIEK